MLNKKLMFTPAVLAVTLLSPHLYAKTVHHTALAEEGRQTLADIRDSAVAAENEADEMRMLVARANSSPESVSWRLEMLKSDVNRMGKEIKSLEQERDALPAWEQHAVDKAMPLLRATASDTQAAIEFFNANRNYLWAETNRQNADRIYDESKQIADSLREYLHYDKLESQHERLDRELAAHSSDLGL